jgi:type I restriction enzyme S subunit
MLSDQFFDRAMMISVGGLSPTINWSTLAKQEFAIPPKPEQRRIAEILWAAEVAIGGGVSLIERVARTRDAYTALFFGAERRLASGIRCVSLTDIVSHASDGPFGSNLKTMHYTDSGPRVIRLQNIADGFFDDADKACIAQSHYDSLSSYHVRPGDVIVAGLGDETHAVGRACQVSSDLGPAVHKADCFCLRANTEVVSQRYLLYYLNSPAARLEVRRRAQGTTRLRINVGNLKQIPAPVYAKPVQEHICDTIDGMNAVLAHTENRLARLRDVSRALRERLLENSCSQKQIA